jgi:hypothetical protein
LGRDPKPGVGHRAIYCQLAAAAEKQPLEPQRTLRPRVNSSSLLQPRLGSFTESRSLVNSRGDSRDLRPLSETCVELSRSVLSGNDARGAARQQGRMCAGVAKGAALADQIA